MTSEKNNNQENIDWAKEAYARLKQQQEERKLEIKKKKDEEELVKLNEEYLSKEKNQIKI